MWTDEVLDKELEVAEWVETPPKWLGVGWLLLGMWLLWEGRFAYEYLHGRNGLLVIFEPYTHLVEAYQLLVQGVFAVLLGLFYFKGLPKVQHYVLGYVLAGVVFHFINVVLGYQSSIFFVDEWASILLVVVSFWPVFRGQDSRSKSHFYLNTSLLVLAMFFCFYPELLLQQPYLWAPKLIGLSCLILFLVRTIPVYFPTFWEPKRWYNHLFLFVGLFPYLL